MRFTLSVTGQTKPVDVQPHKTLLEVIREQLGLKGTKMYCESGVCGACTVLRDGEPVASCSMLIGQADGHDVTTVESLSESGVHPIQQAFIENFGLQCGYCTPGMLLTTKALLEQIPRPSREEIVEFIGGNICRCTGYGGIIRSIQAAADAINGDG